MGEAIKNLATLSGLMLGLFTYLDKIANSQDNRVLARRLLRVSRKPSGLEESWTFLFLIAFDRVFGARHLSARRMWSSFLSSFACAALVAVVYVLTTRGALGQYQGVSGVLKMLQLIVIVPALNWCVDYLALCETRIVLGWASERRTIVGKVILIAIDFLLDIVVHAAMASLALIVLIQCGRTAWGRQLVEAFHVQHWFDEKVSVVAALAKLYSDCLTFTQTENTSFAISLYATCLTSVWLWFYCISAACLHAALVARTPVTRCLLRPRWVRRHPYLVMGLVAFVAVWALGGGILATRALVGLL